MTDEARKDDARPENQEQHSEQAAQQDTPAADTQEQPVKYDDPLEAIEESAAQAAIAERAAQIAAIGEQPEAEPPAESQEAAPEQPAEQTTEQPEATTTRHRVKIDNQEFEVDEADMRRFVPGGADLPVPVLIKSYQLLQAGLRRYQQAAALKNQLERQVQQQPPPAPPPVAPQDAPPSKPETGGDDEAIKKIARTFAYGTEDELAAAIKEFKELIGKARPEQAVPDTEALIQAVDQRLNERMRVQRAQDELKAIAGEFPDVFGDQDLALAASGRAHRMMAQEIVALGADPRIVATLPPAVIGQKHAELRQQVPTGVLREPGDIFRQAARETRERFVTTRAGQTALQQRVERKQTLAAPPTPANAKAKLRQEPKPQDPSDYVKEERMARGQPVF